MVIYFITKQPEICHIIAHRLPEHNCFIFSDTNIFYQTLTNLKEYPDLLLADYTLYNHELYNVYNHINSHYVNLPFIFYNDPCPLIDDRALHWYLMLKYTKRRYSSLNPDNYKDLFKKLQEIILDPQLRPYINLMQETKPLPPDFAVTHLYHPCDSEELYRTLMRQKTEINLSENLFFLLEVLYRRMFTFSSLEDLQKVYESENREIKINSLKVEISQLRTALEKSKDNHCSIIKRKDGYKLFMF